MSCASDLRPGNTYASDLEQRVLRNTRPDASVRLSRAPHFSGGDEHPAALGQAVFIQQWRRATCLAARPKTSKKASGYCSDPCCVNMHLSCLKSLRPDCRWRQTLCCLCFTNIGKNQCDADDDISQGLDCLSQSSS